MKRSSLFIVLLCFYLNSRAQFHEIGAFLGAGNYIGDIGATYFVFPENPAFGLVYKWNRTTRYSLRANAMLMNVKKSDYSPIDFARFNRKYRFKNQIMELSVGAEVNFYDFNLHGNDKKIAPAKMNDQSKETRTQQTTRTSKKQINIHEANKA